MSPLARLVGSLNRVTPRRVFHTLVVMDIAEQEVAAFLPPDRAFCGSEVAAEAGPQFLDRLRCVDDRVDARIELLDALAGLREAASAAR